MNTITVDELLRQEDREGKTYVVTGVPTGTYADRVSYGNRPMLAFILDKRLPCKATTFPYTTQGRIREVKPESDIPLETMSTILDREFTSDNENLGIAAALMDHAIRNRETIEVHGRYIDFILETEFLRIGKIGFTFEGYQFPGVRED